MGGDGGGLGDGDPGPHVEKANEVAVGFAQEGRIRRHTWGGGSGDLGAGTGAEKRAGRPRSRRHRPCRRAHGSHRLAGNEEDSAADDGADHDGGSVRGVEDAREFCLDCLRVSVCCMG